LLEARTPIPSTISWLVAQSGTRKSLFDLDPDLPSDFSLSGVRIKMPEFLFFPMPDSCPSTNKHAQIIQIDSPRVPRMLTPHAIVFHLLNP
jgi:hypothetical protein